MPVESEIELPPDLNGTSLADWAESIMLIEDRKHLSRSDLRQRMHGAITFGDGEADSDIDYLLTEISRREGIAQLVYPFTETSYGIARKPEIDASLYEFLLMLSISSKFREEKRYDEVDADFDVVVKQALMNYLGSGAKAVRFAFPSSDGRPPGFPEAVHWLAGILGLGVGAAVPRPKVKDGGVDVVAWHPFHDCRAGCLIILCQCTVQLDWVPKAKDIVVGKWNGWIDFGLNPFTALAIPFSVPAAFDQWDELRRTVNFVIDRLRLCELLGSQPVTNIDNIKCWTQKEKQLLSRTVA